jgi:hypothetical protein
MHSKNRHPENPCTFLIQADGVAALMPQARRLLELRKYLAAALPQALADSCSVANYKQGKVVVYAINGAVAAKLNLLRPSLQQHLAKRGVEVTGMDIRVQPRQDRSQLVEKQSKITSEAVRKLQSLYEQLPDSELKHAVGRLAGRVPE